MTQAFNGNQAIFQAQWKLLLRADGSKSLYDIDADPTETIDLAKTQKELVVRLEKRLAEMPIGVDLTVPLWKVAMDRMNLAGSNEGRHSQSSSIWSLIGSEVIPNR